MSVFHGVYDGFNSYLCYQMGGKVFFSPPRKEKKPMLYVCCKRHATILGLCIAGVGLLLLMAGVIR